MERTLFSLFILALAVFVTTGCGGQRLPDGMPRLYPVSVTVTQEGTPLANATVSLFPEDAALQQWAPMGTTDAAGTAELFVNGLYKGAPLGTFKVAVSKREAVPDSNPPKIRDFVEPQYGRTDTPLNVVIVAGQKEYAVDAGKKVNVESAN